MSITLSATVPRDREVPSPNSFQNCLLLINITKGDGTPLDASFILEEDIVEISVGRAHMHPLGVLWYSTMELVILYQSVEDVNCIHRILLDVMEFHDEAIMIWTMAPTEAQVTAFQSMWHSNPTARDGELHTPPYRTPPNEETPCITYMHSWVT